MAEMDGRTRIAMTLRSTPIVATPQKKTAARWNPVTQRLDYPPTRAQVRFLRDLCAQLGVRYSRPETKDVARGQIERLVRERERRRAKRRQVVAAEGAA